MTLGQQIKQAREGKNLSQEELAERLGVSRQAVSKWENDNSLPQGLNREMLSQVLELELLPEEDKAPRAYKMSWAGWLGWGLSLILAVLLIAVCIWNSRAGESPAQDGDADGMEENIPKITGAAFYDDEQNEVTPEALWYKSEEMECILLQWEGGTPNSIKVFAAPAGTETEELTELVLTKSVPDGGNAALLSAEPLKEKMKNLYMAHVFFELNFGGYTADSELYNIIYEAAE